MTTSTSINGVRQWRRYPAYKDSGVLWLKAIPSEWKAVRLKFLASFCGGGTPSKENAEFWKGEIPWVSPKDMKVEYVEDTEDHITEAAVANSSTRLIPVGVVLVVVRSGILRHSIPVAISKKTMALNQDMRAIMPKGSIQAEYLAAVIRGHQTALLTEWCKQGATVESIEVEYLTNTPFPVPTLDEQHRIVAFLNQETAKIDAMIAKKERLIDLLQEKRTALISRAVTKGLDSTVPMKESGVEWLGDIPESWNLARNKILFREIDDRSVSGDEELLTVSHITGVTRRSEKPDVTMFLAETLEGYKKCKTGDVVVNTMWAFMGALGTAFVPGVVSPSYNVYRLRDESRLDPRFLDLLYRTPLYKAQVFRYSKGVWHSRLRLYPEAFFEIMTIVPSLCEQRRIVDHVGSIVEEEDRKLTLLQESIDRLREYRIALISAAVTGKIDVREEVEP